MQLVSLNDYPLDSTLHQASVALAGENSRLSPLLAARDTSPGETSAHKRKKSLLMTLILSGICSGALIGQRIYYKTVSIRGTYSSLEEVFSFAGARSKKNTKLYQNRSGETKSNKPIFATQDYRINYANMNLRHQYGISVAEAHTSLPAKRPNWRGARKDGCFCRLQLFQR